MSRQKAESFVVGDLVYYKGTIEVPEYSKVAIAHRAFVPHVYMGIVTKKGVGKNNYEVYLIDDKKVVHTVATQLELVYTV
jgi:hypothetical protein